jgi:ATP-dependent RNA helicase MSS116
MNNRALTKSHVGTLIISPTRELATQIANEALKVCTWHKQMEVQLLVGGMSRSNQLRQWSKGRKDIVVATPGRLKDMLSEPIVRDAMANADMLILDEADTLLEMGFTNDLNFIIDHLPKDRQTFLFSATVSKEIAQIARKSLRQNHDVIDCVPKNESNTHQHIPQYYTILPSEKDQLPHIIRSIAHDQLVNPNSNLPCSTPHLFENSIPPYLKRLQFTRYTLDWIKINDHALQSGLGGIRNLRYL